MQRVRMSLPHYRGNGWQPVVLAVDSGTHGGIQEESLCTTVPADIAVRRVKAWSLSWTRWFGVGNLGLRSWWELLFAGAKLIREEKIDLVFISNTQFVTFTLGRIWRYWLGVPYVIDLQDPWRTSYYSGRHRKERPGGWKYRFAQLQARLFEGWSLRRMSALISVSPTYLADLHKRYTWFGRIPSEVIGFGASETDLAAARELPSTIHAGSKTMRLVSTGAAGPVMQASLRTLFDAVASFRPGLSADLLRMEFLGTSYAAAKDARLSVVPAAQDAGIENLVFETPTRLGLLESLRAQIDATALLLLGSADPAYSASKLYLYFLTGRPVLAIVLKDSVLEQQLKELSFATIVSFDAQGPTTETRRQIHAFLQNAFVGFPPGTEPCRNEPLFRGKYLAPALTARQCALFDTIISAPPN